MTTYLTTADVVERSPGRTGAPRIGRVVVIAAVLIVLAGGIWLDGRRSQPVVLERPILGTDLASDLRHTFFDRLALAQPVPDGVADLTGVRIETVGRDLIVVLEHNQDVYRPAAVQVIDWTVSLSSPKGGYRVSAKSEAGGVSAAIKDLLWAATFESADCPGWSCLPGALREFARDGFMSEVATSISGSQVKVVIPLELVERLDRVTEIRTTLEVRASRRVDELVFTTDLWSDTMDPIPVQLAG